MNADPQFCQKNFCSVIMFPKIQVELNWTAEIVLKNKRCEYFLCFSSSPPSPIKTSNKQWQDYFTVHSVKVLGVRLITELKPRILPKLTFPTWLDTRVGELECSLLSARKEAEEARELILSLEAASLASTSGLTQQMEDLRYSHKESEESRFNWIFPSYLRIRFCGSDRDPVVGSGP